MAETCCGKQNKQVLFYACSGACNVAEAADLAARRLMQEGLGSMYCLAGLGAGIRTMVEKARGADLNVVIDGCEVDCGRKIFEQLGVANVKHFRVTDMGLSKQGGVEAGEQEVGCVVGRIREQLS